MSRPRPARCRLGLLAAMLVLLGGQAAVRAGEEALQAPAPGEFRAYDQPSDDGKAIGVEWGRAPGEGPGTVYVLEMASEEDYQAGRFQKVAEVRYTPPEAAESAEDRPPTLKADHPKYFGYAPRHAQLYYAPVVPARHYPPERRPIPPAREGDLADEARYRYETRLESERLKDERRAINARRYYFRLAVRRDGRQAYVAEDGEPKVVAARARPNYFARFKLNSLVAALFLCTAVLAFIRVARRNPNLFIRKIAGLEAVEEAVGRATEMGRPAFFVHGLDPMSSLSTIAAVTILGRVCRRAAEYGTSVRVTNRDFIVMSVSQEVAKQAYTEAGRPDAFNPDDVCLVAYDQFSYVAAVAGMMVRERPAAIFLMGYFFAEALFLSETGASTGAIQIAGTDAYTQLPFFITTCDYTLMGEELYAASAYLSRRPMFLGTLRGQDVGKAVLMAALLVGTALALLGVEWLANLVKPIGG